MRFSKKTCKNSQEKKARGSFFTGWEPPHHFLQTVAWNFYLDKKKWNFYFKGCLNGGPYDIIVFLRSNFFFKIHAANFVLKCSHTVALKNCFKKSLRAEFLGIFCFGHVIYQNMVVSEPDKKMSIK